MRDKRILFLSPSSISSTQSTYKSPVGTRTRSYSVASVLTIYHTLRAIFVISRKRSRSPLERNYIDKVAPIFYKNFLPRPFDLFRRGMWPLEESSVNFFRCFDEARAVLCDLLEFRDPPMICMVTSPLGNERLAVGRNYGLCRLSAQLVNLLVRFFLFSVGFSELYKMPTKYRR